jgi:hypothetical protein
MRNMKKLAVFLSIAISMVGIVPANANDDSNSVTPTIAIIDTAFDASLFGDSVIEEVCITAGGGCNNRTGFEIGSGSSGANIEVKPRDLENWAHGNLMAKTILEANPNAKLLLIRNAKVYGNAVLSGTEKDLSVALSWLESNAQAYNVVAVSVSRGSHVYVSSNKLALSLAGSIKIYEGMVSRLKASKANPKTIAPLEKTLNDFKTKLASLPMATCPNTNDIKNKIISLQDLEIATIVATGNDADKIYVDYPACIEEAVSVTAHNGSSIVYVGNVSSTTDFASQAATTSEATAKLAGLWSLLYDGSYDSTYETLLDSGFKSGNTVLVN